MEAEATLFELRPLVEDEKHTFHGYSQNIDTVKTNIHKLQCAERRKNTESSLESSSKTLNTASKPLNLANYHISTTIFNLIPDP